MSKFGVGVGDDFPVDDGNGQGVGGDQGPPRDDREEFEEWKRRREAHRAQREQHRQQREEWRERKRAFKEKIRAAAREFGDGRYDEGRQYNGWHSGPRRSHFPFFLWPAVGLMIPILIIAVLVAVIAAVFKSPFMFLGLVLLAFLFFGFRAHHWAGPGHGHWHGHNHGRDRWRGRDDGYDFDLKPTASSTNEPKQTPPSPPPAPQTGK